MDEQSKSTRSSTTCRRCGRTIDLSCEHYPFCSDRCRMADLNAWFDGEYKVSRDIKDSDIETVD